MSDLIETRLAILTEQFAQARLAADALQYTRNKIAVGEIGGDDPDLQEILEAMTARFGRLEDIIIKKVFRAVIALEMDDSQRLIDVLNRIEKLELIDSADNWIELKDLRNLIVHEYELDDLAELQRRVYLAAPTLFESLVKIDAFISDYPVR